MAAVVTSSFAPAQVVELKASFPTATTVEVQSQPTRTINDFLLSRVESNGNAPLVGYPATARGKDDYVYYTAGDLDRYADEAAWKYSSAGLVPEHPNETQAEVVALLAPSSFDYVVSILALSRMGFAVLFLSTRLSTEAYVNLLHKTQCQKMVTSPVFQAATEQIQTQYPQLETFGILEKPDFDFDKSSGPRYPVVSHANASSRVSFIIHSSGSTGLPKPIFQTHQSCLSNYSSGIPYRAFLTLPLFHNHGISTFFRAIWAGRRIALYNSNLPLSGTTLIQAMDSVQPESLHCVPYALKLLAETDRGIEVLKCCKLVLFGGSSCPDDLGDKLVAAGVYLVGHYGATEMGQLMTSFREPSDKSWNYMRPLETAKPYLLMQPTGQSTYECVVLDGLPSKVLSNSDDPPNSFYTRDIFVPHSTIPDAWKYLGRLDDRVTLVNGEKVLPVPFEHQVRQNELVQEAVVFGVDKEVPGLIVIPSQGAQTLSKEQILDALLPTVELANSRTEAFGRISREMIEILDVGTEYPRTDKGTVIRAAFYKHFEKLIESIYIRFEMPEDQDGGGNLKMMTEVELESYLLSLFRDRIGIQNIEKDTDFFEAGVDSLQAITARSHIMREVDLRGKKLGQNVVFEYPNVQALAKHAHSLWTGEGGQEHDEIQIMQELINKYSDFSARVEGTLAPSSETVLLTGATGSLGAHLLTQIVREPTVSRIYCLVRASSPTAAQERVQSMLQAKDLALADELKGKMVYIPADLSQPSLGLPTDVLNTLSETLTKVVHCAWAVNFNLGVRSFETHHIRGTFNLLNLCLNTKTVNPAQLFFCSSISAGAGTPIPGRVGEEQIANLSHAQPMGYARSKVVTEHIIETAAKKTGMLARVLRLGQIIGDTEKGVWNMTEAIPLQIRGALALGALPMLDETPSWMPVDLMAKAVIELSGLSPGAVTSPSEDISTVFQVQNTQLFSWNKDLLPALRRAGLEFKVVSQQEWVKLLRNSEPDPVKNPTVKLVDFFTEKYGSGGPGREGLIYETFKTEAVSETVRQGFDVVKSGLVDKMVAWWKPQW